MQNKYLITRYIDGNKREVLSTHTDLEEALKAGKEAHKKLGCSISCISGTINSEGKIEGKYKFYDCW